MDFESVKNYALKRGYDIIVSQDGKRFGLCPVKNPMCMWDWYDSLDAVFNRVKNDDVIPSIIENNKTNYYFNNEPYSLKQAAEKLNEIGIAVSVFGAEKGERRCKVFCKDTNLENIVLNVGHKKMGFAKTTLPFQKEWNGYYSAGYIK